MVIWAQRNEVVYASTSFNGERPVCVSVGNFTCVRDMDWVNTNNIVQLYDDAVAVHEAEVKATPAKQSPRFPRMR